MGWAACGLTTPKAIVALHVAVDAGMAQCGQYSRTQLNRLERCAMELCNNIYLLAGSSGLGRRRLVQLNDF